MATREPGPIRAARMLRSDLRRAREVAGLTQIEVAERMEWSLSKVARIENGDVGIVANDLRALARLFGMGEAATREMLRRNDASRARGWWYEYRTVMSSVYADIVGMESDADKLCDFATSVIPGLLQTPGYAEAVISTGRELYARESTEQFDVGLRVELRLERQRRILDGSDPPELMVVLDESTLYRSFGGVETMSEQVRRLAELARRPHIRVRILPFERLSLCPHGYLLVDRELVYAELVSGDVLFDDPVRVGLYADLFGVIWRSALDADRTGQLLRRVAGDYESGRQPRPWLWE
ncbi:helix-turn-helix transcriptional regulator [Actinoplanes sp. NPDC026623]|uniref:helix-turn-helix domain-containing protein n=1 Tax=Actinoplanes sp. NPDC026623 TaxID=3155610 RepID=UPI0033F16778